MANLSIKNLPDGVCRELKRAAQAQGRSLNTYIVCLLQLSVEERSRRKMMRNRRGQFRKFLASLPRLGDSAPLIRGDREKGH